MKVLVIDGQGGGMGARLIQQLKAHFPEQAVTAVGTNALATSAMLKAGADNAATGENPVVFSAARAQLILGPVGIVLPNAMLGEITPRMAEAVASSPAQKILVPASRCSVRIVGLDGRSMAEYVEEAVGLAGEFLSREKIES